MKKKIKHIIKSCAVISLLAMTLFGCSQVAGPGPVGEQKFAITSIEFNKDRFYHSEAENPETEVTVTVKGTGFSLLKKEAKQEIKIAFYEKTPVGADSQDNTLTGVLINPELIKAASNQESRNPSDPTPVVPAPDPEVTDTVVPNPAPEGTDPVVPDAPVFTTENCKINYENNTATVTFKFSKLNKFCSQETLQGTTKASVKVEGTTEASNSAPDSIPFIDTVSDKITFEANVIVNDKSTEIRKDLLITGRTFLECYDLYENTILDDYLPENSTYRLNDITDEQFKLYIEGYNFINKTAVIKFFKNDGSQEGNDITLPIIYKIHDGRYITFTFPKKIGTYTFKLFLDGVEQKYYYEENDSGNYDRVEVPNYTISVLGDLSITSVTIPKENNSNAGKTIQATITGTNFTEYDKDNFKVTCNTDGIIPELSIGQSAQENTRFEYVNDTTYKLNLIVPAEAGSYPITVSYGDKSITNNFVVTEAFSVTYESAHGTVPEKETDITPGTTLSKPAALSETGYTFDGWFNGNTKIESDFSVNSNVTLTAHWTPIVYTITYNNCEVVMHSNPKIYTIEKEVRLVDATLNGSNFAGWFSDPSCAEAYKVTYIKKGSTGNKAFWPKWEDKTAPAEVTNFNAVITNKGTILKWTEPTDTDFAKVIISDGSLTIEVEKGTPTHTITNNTTPAEYTIITVDNKGNKSQGTSTKSVKLANNSEPIFVRNVTLKNKEFAIVAFGQWPQTVKNATVTINESQATTNINGWECYKGSDECYYTKVIAEPVSSNSGFSIDTDTGKAIEKGKSYYFRMEPIEWRVLTNDYNGSGKKLLLAEKALMTGKFDNQSRPYQNSEIRARLNGLDMEVSSPNGKGENRNYNGCGFLQKAFSETQRSYIAETTVSDDGNTKDKIFLVTKDDMLNPSYGFESFYSTDNTVPSRQRENTDYTRATGAWESRTWHETIGFWWIRSDTDTRIKNAGSFESYDKTDTATSIVPAICINQF